MSFASIVTGMVMPFTMTPGPPDTIPNIPNQDLLNAYNIVLNNVSAKPDEVKYLPGKQSEGDTLQIFYGTGSDKPRVVRVYDNNDDGKGTNRKDGKFKDLVISYKRYKPSELKTQSSSNWEQKVLLPIKKLTSEIVSKANLIAGNKDFQQPKKSHLQHRRRQR